MSSDPRTRTLESGSIVRVVYHTPRETYHLEGVVAEDDAAHPGVMVSLEEDPYSPVTTARVYTTFEAWLDARERCVRNDTLPCGYVRERLRPASDAEGERPVA